MKDQNTRNRNKYMAAIAALVVAVGLTTFLFVGQQPQDQQASTGDESAQVKEQQSDHITYTGKKGVTALEQLKQEAEDVTTETSSYGEYVESIGSYKGGQDGKYWSFYVDGEMASVGASEYTAKGGEKIEWKFEKSQ